MSAPAGAGFVHGLPIAPHVSIRLPRLPAHSALPVQVLLAVILLAGTPELVRAQALPAFGGPVGDSVAAATDTVQMEGITPTGAFLRSVLVPGWGHAEVGSHLRGAFYLGTEGGIGWMLLRIRSRLASATGRLDVIESDALARLTLDGVVDPAVQEDSLAANDEVRSARGLVEARRQQREDWIALGIFFVLLGGADAFVSAHLKDFPAEPVFNADDSGRVELGLRIPVGGRPPGG